MKKRTTEDFIRLANNIHNGKYNYNKTIYTNKRSEVVITCPIHGDFNQIAQSHINGHGCPLCGKVNSAKSRTMTKEEFVERANKIHGGKYNYSKVDYVNANTDVSIICPIHGEFWQRPSHHLNGNGCKICSAQKEANKRKLTTEQFIQKARVIHHEKYDYSKVKYTDASTKVCIICSEHGEFWQLPYDHLNGHGCSKCGNLSSKAEDDIMTLVSQVKPQQGNREILNGKELDIYIPSLKLGIEYNGLRWHSEEFGKDCNYHLDKLNEYNSKGICLIQIFEDEWIYHREICESKLKHICGIDNDKTKIFARKCSIREITNHEAWVFLDQNHIQGHTKATVYLGCFHNGEIIGVMTFKQEKCGYWELNRFASDIRYNCIGIGGKMFKYFIRNYGFKEIKSFADRRWTIDVSDNLYTKIGFDFAEFTKPDYRYIKENVFKRFHKFGFRKQSLNKKYGLPLTMTESEMTKKLGYSKIWDCGLIKYVHKNKDAD